MPRRRCLVFILCMILLFHLKAKAFDKQTYMVPMRDGIRLATDVYLPSSEEGPWPAILIRTPYGRLPSDDDIVETMIMLFTGEIQYAVVIQDTRGRFDSEGVDSLVFSDGWGRKQDGYDTVEWTAQQEWCTGRVGMFGPSAMGIAQYLAAGAAPPHLRCCLAIVAASNLYTDAIFYGGAYRRSLVDGGRRGRDQRSAPAAFRAGDRIVFNRAVDARRGSSAAR